MTALNDEIYQDLTTSLQFDLLDNPSFLAKFPRVREVAAFVELTQRTLGDRHENLISELELDGTVGYLRALAEPSHPHHFRVRLSYQGVISSGVLDIGQS